MASAIKGTESVKRTEPSAEIDQIGQYPAVPLDASIGLAVPGRPVGPWSRRTGAPEASATRGDRSLGAHEIAHGTRHDTPGQGSTGRDDARASALLGEW
jgi:hypothetical protein